MDIINIIILKIMRNSFKVSVVISSSKFFFFFRKMPHLIFVTPF